MADGVALVDVTLRDGGYVNKHSWTVAQARRVVRACAAAGVPLVEAGYLRPARHADDGGALPSASCPPQYLEILGEEAAAGPDGGAGLVVMAHARDVSPAVLAGLARFGVRVVRMPVSPSGVRTLAPYAEAVHGAGMAFSVNLIRVSELAEPDVMSAARAAEELSADVFYLADSNGSMFPDDVARLALRVRETVGLTLGFHSHDGISMGFANALAAMQHGFRWIDASLCGMGKGGGNLALELITTYLHSRAMGNFSVEPLVDAATAVLAPWKGDHILARCESIVGGMLDLNLESLASIRSRGSGTLFTMLDEARAAS
ncbi:4-hydroxy-2-oxovalerate aldolase [Streptomyces mashuensis]|uniref:4-hydroxy-2-oxovalerate aldolase n=1 Tax=Streptomyces mashuensis TaxID=33904 RepID=A0A919B965_9ACTN|nr:4-hydroxy-2-oxovalerate aldolase [Streptomyces mashuensis]